MFDFSEFNVSIKQLGFRSFLLEPQPRFSNHWFSFPNSIAVRNVANAWCFKNCAKSYSLTYNCLRQGSGLREVSVKLSFASKYDAMLFKLTVLDV